MRIIFMGTPDFAVPALKALTGSRHEVVLVISQPDRSKGRSAKPVPTPVKACALEAGIPVLQPEKVRNPEVLEQIRERKPDVIVVAAYGQILPQALLDIPRIMCVNIHGSLLPKYRGAAPIQWAVINGEKTSGITIMKMEAGLDTGDILVQKEVPLDPKETSGSLFDRLSLMGGEVLLDALDKIEQGLITPVKQDDALATWSPMLRREDGRIDWSMDAAAIECRVRGMDPWPSAYTFLDGKMLKIWSADVSEDEPENSPGAESAGFSRDVVPGTVVSVGKDRFLVAAGKGTLAVREVQLEGKKRMSVQAFLLGYKLREGTLLGAD